PRTPNSREVPAIMNPARRTALVLAAAALALTGCSATGSEPPGTEAAPKSSLSATPSPADTDSDTSVPSVLTAEPSGRGAPCISDMKKPGDFVIYDPIAKAKGDLTVTGASAVGKGVQFVEGEAVVVTSRSAFGPGLLIGPNWPVEKNKVLDAKTDLSTRANLIGMNVKDGQRVLPLLRFKVTPPAALDSLRLEYEDADRNSASVELPIGTKFSPGKC
ncbi:MAG: hypothetical protein ABWX57_05465, partial [Aeromicrobium sp.]